MQDENRMVVCIDFYFIIWSYVMKRVLFIVLFVSVGGLCSAQLYSGMPMWAYENEDPHGWYYALKQSVNLLGSPIPKEYISVGNNSYMNVKNVVDGVPYIIVDEEGGVVVISYVLVNSRIEGVVKEWFDESVRYISAGGWELAQQNASTKIFQWQGYMVAVNMESSSISATLGTIFFSKADRFIQR